MYVGDAKVATAEKGKVLIDDEIQALTVFIRAVKADKVTSKLVEEFNQRQAQPCSPDFWMEAI
jgi:hypothetical protein